MNEEWRNEIVTKGAAIDAQEAYMADHPLDGYEDELALIDILRNLPPAQPELIETTAYIRGFEQGRTQGRIDVERTKVKWIKKMKVTETDAYTSYDPEWYCPKCGTKYDPFFAQRVKFCCMCGVGIMGEKEIPIKRRILQ